MPFQIGENVSQFQSIKAATHTTTQTGAAVDCTGYDEVTWVFDVGAITATSLTLKIQESATSGGSYADITGATTAALTASEDDQSYVARVRVNPLKPFQKAIGTIAGTGNIPHSAVALRHTTGLRKPVATPSFQVTAV